MQITAIIPVHNARDYLRACLIALGASTRPPDQLIVVDDSSSDGSAAVARGVGATVISLTGGPRGPAFARNRGAEIATGDVLVFLDADVAVHSNTLARIEQYLTEHSEIAALFGSYDAQPAGRRIVSRFKNLLHHYVHQHAQREAFTFWAGCGAIWRRIFAERGGFAESYTRPSIEDIELGARLRQAGYRVRLCPEIQVTHLKEWALLELLRSDIFDRAIPWSQLLFTQRRVPNDLNLETRSRWSALAAWAIVLAFVLGWLWQPAWFGGALALIALLALNRDLYRFFARQGGNGFGLGAFCLHWFYLSYSSAVFGVMLTRHGLRRIIRR
jgi:glycosyltransferase involved in cell wall biosynthesis